MEHPALEVSDERISSRPLDVLCLETPGSEKTLKLRKCRSGTPDDLTAETG